MATIDVVISEKSKLEFFRSDLSGTAVSRISTMRIGLSGWETYYQVRSHGLISVRPQPSSPLGSRVTTLAPRDCAIDAIMRSIVAAGPPARLRAATMVAAGAA